MSEFADPLQVFGKFLMENLRDRAIQYCDRLLRGEYAAPALACLQAELHSLSGEQRSVVRRCVIEIVDDAIHDFLFQIQEYVGAENAVQVYVNSVNVAELSDGLHGEIFGKEGWRAKYSKYGEPPEIA